jgi:hypothetical protein
MMSCPGGAEVKPLNTTRRLAVLPVAVALTTIGLTTAAAHADPSPDPGPEASCTYKLTAPSRVNVSGADMVTATITPGACTGLIQPNSFTVCVEMLGSGTPQCNFSPIYKAVQVYFTPYRKGATYRSTGRGCGNLLPSGDESCTSLGPYTTTL